MNELPVTNPKVAELFSPGGPNDMMLYASLDGRYPGVALVDDSESPMQCVLRTAYGTTFLGGSVDDTFLTDSVDALRKTGTIWVVLSEIEATQRKLPSGYDFNIERIEFNSISGFNEKTDAVSRELPEGFQLVEMDRTLLENCIWGNEMKQACGNLENFLRHGFGVCLLRDDQIISEAYAMFEGAGRMELGAITHETHQGQGYGSITCSELIRLCHQRKKQVYWSCHQGNTPSVRLARKLGFSSERKYHWIRYKGT